MQAIALGEVKPVIFFYLYQVRPSSPERVHDTSYTI
jgi:hypothetical protein